MSIDDDLSPIDTETESITEISRALDLFTDRLHERRHFACYLNDRPPKRTILFFHGDGGNGKSWLLRMLKERYCHALSADSWEYVKALKDDEEFTANYATYKDVNGAIQYVEGAAKLPYAYLDFGDEKKDDRNLQPRQAFDGLVLLRRQLGGRAGFKFPVFDYAMALYQTKGLGQSLESVKTLLPAEEADFADLLINAMTESKALNQAVTVFSLFNKYLTKESFALYLKKRAVDEQYWQTLANLDPHSQLFDSLPGLLAKDLNTAMSDDYAPSRVVLLFDTHEAFWGTGKQQESVASYHQRDEWLRRLLRALELERGIVVAIAGRERPRWH